MNFLGKLLGHKPLTSEQLHKLENQARVQALAELPPINVVDIYVDPDPARVEKKQAESELEQKAFLARRTPEIFENLLRKNGYHGAHL